MEIFQRWRYPLEADRRPTATATNQATARPPATGRLRPGAATRPDGANPKLGEIVEVMPRRCTTVGEWGELVRRVGRRRRRRGPFKFSHSISEEEEEEC